MPIEVKIRDTGLECEVRELPAPKAKISTANQLNVDISDSPKYTGKIRSVFSFGGAVNVLNFLCRFISAKARIFNRHEAKASTAPAVEIEADTAFQTATEAPVIACPVADVKVDQKERVSVYAKLVAYRRAGCVYIKRIFMGHKAKAIAAPGAVAAYREEMALHRTSKAVAADSAIMESRFNKISHSYEATASPAPAQTVPAVEMTLTAKHTAQAGKAAVVAANINNAFRASHSARMATYIEPFWDGGVLVIKQAYNATMNANRLEVE